MASSRRPSFFAYLASTLAIRMKGGLLPVLFCFLFIGASVSQAFILQELPLYRNTRDSDLSSGISGGLSMVPFHGPTGPVLFARPARAFNFQRLNRLRDYWHRNEALRRLAESSAWNNGGKRAAPGLESTEGSDNGAFL